MNTKFDTAVAAPESRELEDVELDVVSGAGIHISFFGVRLDIGSGGAACISTNTNYTCYWEDGSVEKGTW